MCCIFTCFGWLIDLFQRAWVFAMSFCMSGAVCCVLMLGSLSGVALGYNYSLAEYMDLKETNVSVYLKRGVFDDEGMSEDMNFRRSGEEEEEGFDQAPNSQRRFGGGRQGGDSSPLSSGRRLDDSLLQSNENHGYEGSLMKLTMAPPYPITTTTPMPLRDEKVDEIIMKHAPDSLNQLKEIQSLINYRKVLAAQDPSKTRVLLAGLPSQLISGEQNYMPPHILNAQPSPGRRVWQAPSTSSYQFNNLQNYVPRKIHPALTAVPPPNINEQGYWEAFKSSQLYKEETAPTSPQAIRLNTLDQDMFPTEPPTLPVFTEETMPLSTQRKPTQFMNLGLDTGGDQFEQKRILDNYDTSRTKPYGRIGGNEDTSPKSDNEYYDDDIKGLPVRRKRHIHGIKSKSRSDNGPESEKEKSDGENFDKVNTVNHNNVIANTDPSISISKLISESKLNTKASDLITELARPESGKKKSDGENSDKVNTVNHSNLIDNTDPSISISKLVSESKLNTIDLISKLARPESEKEKSKSENSDKVNTVNHNNVIDNTDPSLLVSKLVSESKLSKLEKTPLYDQLINNKVYETESRIFMRGLFGKTSLGLNKINNHLNDASSADPGFFNQRRFVFSFV